MLTFLKIPTTISFVSTFKAISICSVVFSVPGYSRFPICTAYIRIFSLAIFRQPSALSYSATIIFASLLLYRRSMLPNSTSMTLSTASLFQVRVNSAPAVYLLLSPERTLFLNGPLESPLISRKGSFSQPDTLSDRILKLVFSDISTSVLTFVLPPVKVTDNL